MPGGPQFKAIVRGLPKLFSSAWKGLLLPKPTGDRDCTKGAWWPCGCAAGGGIEIWVAEVAVDMAVGDADAGGRGQLGLAAKYFATISITPDHWVPSSGILEGLQTIRGETVGD